MAGAIQLQDFYDALFAGEHQRCEALLSPDCVVEVSHPVNTCAGPTDALQRGFLPLQQAMPDVERRPLIAVRNDASGDDWEIGTGFFAGTFAKPMLGIPASGRQVLLRYTEMVRFEHGVISHYYLLLDFLDLMLQAGLQPIRASLGATHAIQPPLTQDGLYPQSVPDQDRESQQLVLAMLDHLGEYDGVSLESMDLGRFWHPDFIWYGPAGIGTTRGIAGFRAHHQGPFLAGFPDRVVDHHTATVACGNYAATGGWPHMHATHSGPDWLGMPPTGTYLELRVMDIWRREGNLLRENWVGIDILHMLKQMGLDVFAQLQNR